MLLTSLRSSSGFPSTGHHRPDGEKIERMRHRCSPLTMIRLEVTYVPGGDGSQEKKPGKIQALSDFMNKDMMYPHWKCFKTNLNGCTSKHMSN